jgi:hypothetical protein
MGDVVAIIADPVARVVGLDKSKCGCGNRQAALNETIPFSPTTDPGIVI